MNIFCPETAKVETFKHHVHMNLISIFGRCIDQAINFNIQDYNLYIFTKLFGLMLFAIYTLKMLTLRQILDLIFDSSVCVMF